MNPIENLWGILVRNVYAHQVQFKDVHELLEVIMEAWDEVLEECLENLIRSMQKRLFECVMAGEVLQSTRSDVVVRNMHCTIYFQTPRNNVTINII